MKKPLAVEILCCTVILVSSSCFAQVAGVSGAPSLPIDFSKHSDKFMEEAADRGAAEVELGKVAMQKSKDGHVIDVASAIVKDRAAANEELQRVAAKEKLSIPTTVSPEGAAMISAMKGKSGRDFETAYAQQVATDYNETIQLFQSEAKSPDADLASYARTTLPVLNQHLQMARGLAQPATGRGTQYGAVSATPR